MGRGQYPSLVCNPPFCLGFGVFLFMCLFYFCFLYLLISFPSSKSRVNMTLFTCSQCCWPVLLCQMSTVTPWQRVCLQLINDSQDTALWPDHANGWLPVLDGPPLPQDPDAPKLPIMQLHLPNWLQRRTCRMSLPSSFLAHCTSHHHLGRAGNSHRCPSGLVKDGKATARPLIYEDTWTWHFSHVLQSSKCPKEDT